VITIREEVQGDIPAIRNVNDRAFGQPLEGHLVDTLRANGGVLLSLVASMDDHIVGHILYSPACIGGVRGAALGPMAVVPAFQRQGIGSQLVESGTRRLQETGCSFIVVLGHEAYYPRFGFVPASIHQIQCQWNVPDANFMVKILGVEKMRGVAGLAEYRDEFALVS